MSKTQNKPATDEAMLYGISWDNGIMCLRYNDACETYVESFSIESGYAYDSLGEIVGAGEVIKGNTLLRFLRSELTADRTMMPRRLVLTAPAPNLKKTILYDDNGLLDAFEENFGLRHNEMMVMHQVSPRRKEMLKA